MSKPPSHRQNYLLALAALALCAALSAHAQGRGGGFGGGGGGFGGGGAGGGSRNVTTRQYPNAGTIGDVYFTIDPETRRVVLIGDEESTKAALNILSNLDRPKPQVLL